MAVSADAPAAETSDGRGNQLKRAISGKLLYLFILGDVLGAGIYALIGKIAGQTGGMLWLPLAVALLLALLTAASYAELVTKYPKAGGAAVFAHRAYRSDLVSFVVGFCMLAAGLVSVAGLALAFAGDYLHAFLDVPAVPAALVFLAAVAALNLRGISESLGANVVMTVVELSGLLFIIALGALVLGRGDGDLGRVVELPAGTSALPAVLGAALLAFYSFVGFETSANVAEETVNPARNYPRALFGGLLTAGVVYVLVGLTVSAAVPAQQLAESSGPLLEVVRVADIGLPAWVFSLVALVAVANGALLTSIMTSRLTYGMASDGLLPRALGRVLPRRRSPWAAILVTTLASMALALTGDLETLANTVVLLLLVVFVSTNTAVLVLRRDKVDHQHFRTPVVLPILALASCVVLLSQQDGAVWLRALLLIAVGVVLYVVTAAVRRRTARRGDADRR
ncbi:APC family permease [Micromonospora mangrovi]|uniref:APC family permease n=2 Tax=Micromonospora TaxID=1873 RepID=A0AAU8HI34_9ACTN